MSFLKKIGELIMGLIDSIINQTKALIQRVSGNIPDVRFADKPVEIKTNSKYYAYAQQIRINKRRRREEIARETRRQHYIQAKI